MHGGVASELWHNHPRKIPVAIVRVTLTETPLSNECRKVERPRNQASNNSPTLNPPAFNIQPYYSVPKPKRLIPLAICVPSETKPNSRSNGCVYLNTIEVNLWYGSSEIYNRSRGMS